MRRNPDSLAELPLRPDLADLCALEWARIEVFDARDVTPLSADEAARLTPDAWAAFRLRPVPSLRMVETEIRVSALWSALAHGHAIPVHAPGRETLLVWRRGFSVYHRPLEAPEATAIRRLAAGATLAELGEASALEEEPLDATAQRLLGSLQQWLADGLLSAVDG